MTIDSFVWFVLFFAATIPVAAVTGQIETTATSANASLEGTPATVAFSLWFALGIGYHTLVKWWCGQTIGKFPVGITVRNDDGSCLSLRSSVVPNVARLVDFSPSTTLWELFLCNPA